MIKRIAVCVFGCLLFWVGSAAAQYTPIPVFDMNTTEPYTQGEFLQLQWRSVETSEGVYNWSAVTNALAALPSGQQLWIVVQGGIHAPAYIASLPGMTSAKWENPSQSCAGTAMAVPWNSVFVAREVALINDFGANFGTEPRITGVGGLGNNDAFAEEHIVEKACASGDDKAWESASPTYSPNAVIGDFESVYGAWFNNTYNAWLIFGTIGNGFPEDNPDYWGLLGQIETAMIQWNGAVAAQDNGTTPTYLGINNPPLASHQELGTLSTAAQVCQELALVQQTWDNPAGMLSFQMYDSDILLDPADVQNLENGTTIKCG